MSSTALHSFIRHLHRLVGTRTAGGLADADLLERFLHRRDEAAFEVLVWRHGPMVWNVCQRVLHHAHDAEDAFQATFLAFVRRASSIRRRTSLSSWLYKVAYRVALKARARAAQQARQETNGVDMLPAKPAPPESLWHDLRQVLDEEVNRLPKKYRLPVVLCYLEGKTTDEAAQELGCPRGTIATRLAWARARLRRRLTRRGLTVSAGLLTTALSQGAASATLPAALVHVTVQNQLLWMAGNGAAAVIAPPIAALADGILKATTVTNVKVAAMLLTVSVLAAGVGLAVNRTEVARQSETEQQERTRAVGKEAEQPKRDKGEPARVDQYGDPLPPGALARIGTARLWHGWQQYPLVYSPDGAMLASCDSGSVIRLLDPATGKEIRQIRPRGDSIRSFAFAPDGKALATASFQSTSLKLWDVATGKEMRQVPCGDSGVSAIAFSADGKAFAAALRDKTIRLWDVGSWQETHRFAPQAEYIHAVALLPGEKTLVSASGDDIIRWFDVATGQEIRQLDQKLDSPRSLILSPDGKTLASVSLQMLSLLKAATGEKISRTVLSPDYGGWHLCFSADGRILACGGSSRSVKSILPPPAGFAGRSDTLVPTALTSDGKLAALVDAKGVLHLWDTATGRGLRRIDDPPIEQHEQLFSPDGRTLAVKHKDGVIRLWDTATGKLLLPLPLPQELTYARAFSPDSRKLATASTSFLDKTIRLWDTATGKELRRLPWQDGTVATRLVFTRDGKGIVSAHHVPKPIPGKGFVEGSLRLWDVDTARLLRRFRGAAGHEAALSISPDGKMLAASTREAIVLWEVASGKERGQFAGHRDSVWSLAFSPDGRLLASGSGDHTAIVWDITGLRNDIGLPTLDLGPDEINRLWTELSGADGARAHRALWMMVAAARQAVPFLARHLQPAAPIESERLARLIADMDSDQFKVRTQAFDQLEKLGELAEPALRKALAGMPAQEARQRLENLLDKVEARTWSQQQLLTLRALEVLEQVGTTEARQVLETLAKGAPEARLTQEAKASLERLARRHAASP
jgi:RNA polymerase sigma factor (sigma-70 family)